MIQKPKKSASKKAQLMEELKADRYRRGLVRCVVYVPPDVKTELAVFVEDHLGGEYSPRK